MFTPEPMKKVTIVAPKSIEKELLEVVGKTGSLHVIPIDELKLFKFRRAESAEVEKYAVIVERLNRILEGYGKVTREKPETMGGEFSYSFEQAIKYVDEAERELGDLINQHNKLSYQLSQQLVELGEREKEVKLVLKYLPKLRKGVERNTFEKVGFIQKRLIPKFKYYLKGRGRISFAIQPTKTTEALVYVSYSEVYREWVEKLLVQFNFKEIKVLSLDETKLKQTLQEIKEESGKKKEEIEEIKKELKEVMKKKYKDLPLIYKHFHKLHAIETVREEGGETNFFFALQGWVPKSKLKKLRKELEKNFPDKCLIVSENPEPGEKTPINLKNSIIFRPFQYVVKMYGLPAYKAFNPTAITALFFPIMFGMMFGDFGQGLALLGAGLLAMKLKESWKPLGRVISVCGAASAVFGIIYGESFLRDFTLKPLFEEPPFEPLQNVMQLVAIALLFGVFQIILGLVINITLKLKNGEYLDGLIGEKSLSTLILYSSGVYLVWRFQTNFSEWGRHAELMLFIVVPLLLIAINKLFFESEGGKISEKFMETFGIIFELILSLLSNSLSYVRLAAFAVAHVAFAAAAKMIAGPQLTPAGLGVLVGFNFLVLSLEALVVFIQSLRLVFYEFYSKFFESGELEYSPFILK